jgi:hypothetical protein
MLRAACAVWTDRTVGASVSAVAFDKHSRALLTRHDLGRFAGVTLFDRVARVVARAECLPRKELFESWEVARRVRRRMRGGRVVELAAGHGLVAWLLLLLDASSERGLAIDASEPPSAGTLSDAITAEWPRLRDRMERRTERLEQVALEPNDLVVSVHACGALTDRVLSLAIAARARVAVLPCCHDAATCDAGGLLGFHSLPLAVDATRVARLRAPGLDVHPQTIPAEITPHNRLILAPPPGGLMQKHPETMSREPDHPRPRRAVAPEA